MFRYEFWWTLGNRLRWALGLKPIVRRCCRNPENLYVYLEAKDLVVHKCRVCNSRHFELTIDPGKLGVRGQAL